MSHLFLTIVILLSFDVNFSFQQNYCAQFDQQCHETWFNNGYQSYAVCYCYHPALAQWMERTYFNNFPSEQNYQHRRYPVARQDYSPRVQQTFNNQQPGIVPAAKQNYSPRQTYNNQQSGYPSTQYYQPPQYNGNPQANNQQYSGNAPSRHYLPTSNSNNHQFIDPVDPQYSQNSPPLNYLPPSNSNNRPSRDPEVDSYHSTRLNNFNRFASDEVYFNNNPVQGRTNFRPNNFDRFPLVDDSQNRETLPITINQPARDNILPSKPPKTKLAPSDLKSLRKHPNFNLINDRTCGAYSSNRDTSSFNAQLAELPWAVLLGYQQQNGQIDWRCEGTLISNRYVLTSATCVNRDLQMVRIGEHTISTDCDGDGYECVDPVQDIKIEKIIQHPDFNYNYKVNDIALLKLSIPADTKKNNVKTICLPVDEEIDFKNLKKEEGTLIIFGWGSNRKSDILQKTYVSHVDTQECTKGFSSKAIFISDANICADSDVRGNICLADSGSAITALGVLNNRPKLYQYGVKSVNVDCQNRKEAIPAVYTNIRYHLNWILNNIYE